MSTVSTSCNKSGNDKLQQACFLQTCCNLMKLTSSLQLFDKLQQAGKVDNLQQVFGVLGCVQVELHATVVSKRCTV